MPLSASACPCRGAPLSEHVLGTLAIHAAALPPKAASLPTRRTRDSCAASAWSAAMESLLVVRRYLGADRAPQGRRSRATRAPLDKLLCFSAGHPPTTAASEPATSHPINHKRVSRSASQRLKNTVAHASSVWVNLARLPSPCTHSTSAWLLRVVRSTFNGR